MVELKTEDMLLYLLLFLVVFYFMKSFRGNNSGGAGPGVGVRYDPCGAQDSLACTRALGCEWTAQAGGVNEWGLPAGFCSSI
tara:strand:- start:1031 stop:1276 length:246 start_codon:yes stop_codon:yes gene_type:complete